MNAGIEFITRVVATSIADAYDKGWTKMERNNMTSWDKVEILSVEIIGDGFARYELKYS